jgi:hypothetical protein
VPNHISYLTGSLSNCTTTQTFTGRRFPVLAATAADIDIRDIAHGLSNMCRFAGMVRTFYSVGQHSVLVSRNVPQKLALAGLLHDAHETFMGADLPRPIKHAMPPAVATWWKDIESRLDAAIAAAFKLPKLTAKDKATIKAADDLLLTTEARDFMAPLHTDWHHRPIGRRTGVRSCLNGSCRGHRGGRNTSSCCGSGR